MSVESCSSCGMIVKPSAKFCTKCGAALASRKQKKAELQHSLPPTPALLAKSATERVSKTLDSLDKTSGFCITCGVKLRHANKKNDSKMCYKCYMQTLQQQRAQEEYQPLMRASGTNGQVELFPNKVRLRREGVIQTLWRYKWGDKEILLNQISSIQFKQPSPALGYPGYIRFGFSGADQMSGIRDIYKDANAVTFNLFQQNNFIRIKAAIEQRISEIKYPIERPQQVSQPIDFAGQIQKLAELRAQGIVTEEEFQSKKRELLARM
jgi:hypothetical protein